MEAVSEYVRALWKCDRLDEHAAQVGSRRYLVERVFATIAETGIHRPTLRHVRPPHSCFAMPRTAMNVTPAGRRALSVVNLTFIISAVC
jgi:hypothetical protein